MICTSKGM